jgi:hypothetical protein
LLEKIGKALLSELHFEAPQAMTERRLQVLFLQTRDWSPIPISYGNQTVQITSYDPIGGKISCCSRMSTFPQLVDEGYEDHFREI